MPVDTALPKEGMIYQREQYAKGGPGARYWDYRDKVALDLVTGNDIVDVGCGEGLTLEKLVRLFPDKNIRGIDSEPENIQICSKYDLPVFPGDVYALPFDDSSMDCVMLMEVIEHLNKPEQALVEIRRVLKPGGRVIIVFPNDAMFKLVRILTGMIREAFYESGHVRQWTPKAIRTALASNGFTPCLQKNLPCGLWLLSLHHVVVAEKQ